jgi:hypothetical protein
MPNCPDVRNQYGKYCRDEDSSSMELPTTLVDICAGDFLGSNTTDSRLVAALISTDVAWNTDLATLVRMGSRLLVTEPEVHGLVHTRSLMQAALPSRRLGFVGRASRSRRTRAAMLL